MSNKVRSKPRHGEPSGRVEGGKVYNTPQQQQLIDELVAELNQLRDDHDALKAKVDAEHP